jgi:VWFA-related protein
MNRNTKRLLVALVPAALLIGLLVSAATPTIVEEERVIAVEVPVQVIKGGAPVRGLTADNFEILLKGKRQEIVGFEVVDLGVAVDVAAGETPTMPVSARRHFLFLFDMTFVDVGSVLRARESVMGVVDQMHPTDLAAVATHSTTVGPKLVLGFTSDRRQIRAAVETLGAPELLEGATDPLRLTIVESDPMGGQFGLMQEAEMGGGAARAGVGEALAEYLMDMQTGLDRTDKQQQRIQVSNLTRDFKLLASMMASVEGRKYVVYLSEGFDSEVLIATADRGEIARMNQAGASGRIWEVDNQKRFGDVTEQAHLEEMLEEFRRADCVIQAVNIAEAAAEDVTRGVRSGNDALFAMADGTGGELYRNFNDLGEAMDEMFERTSVSYVLVIQPDEFPTDGSYHKIKVKLKNAPKGSKTFHRPGVYAPKPFEQRAGLERQLQAANLILSGVERGNVPVSVLAVPFASPDGTGRVVLLVEADGPALVGQTRFASLPGEIYAYVLDGYGGIHDFAANVFTLDTRKVGAHLNQSGLKFYGELTVPPGDYSVRVLVRNGASGTYRLQNLPVHVPRFADGEPAVMPPLVPEPLGKWVLVREPPGDTSLAFPFMLDGQPYLPGARPEITEGQPAPVCLVGYNLGAGALTATGRILGADGSVAEGPRIESVRRAASDLPGAEMLVASFVPDGLAPGAYTLEVTVRDPGSDLTASGKIPLVVTAR